MADDMFGGMSPEEIQALLATMGDPAELEGIQGQQAIADKLRSRNPGDREMLDGGHGQRFADIGGMVSDVIDNKRGEKMGSGLDEQRRSIYANQKDQAGNFLDAMSGHSRQIQDIKKPDLGALADDPKLKELLAGLM